MILRFFICLFILLLFFFSTCFVGLAKYPQVCLDSLRPIDPKIQINLITQCIYTGKFSLKETSDLYTRRGNIYKHLEEYKLAIRDYDRAIQTSSKSYGAYINRGKANYILGNYNQAIQDNEKAIELRPNYRIAYYNLAWVLATSEDPQYRDGEKALKVIQIARKLSTFDDYRILDTLAAAYAELGQFDKAIDAVSKAIKQLEGRGDEELSNAFKEVLSDYKLSRKHYLKSKE